MAERPAPEESAGGHYVTAGAAIAGLGTVGLVLAMAVRLTTDVELGFIDARTMAAICLLFIGLGSWMMLSGRHDDQGA